MGKVGVVSVQKSCTFVLCNFYHEVGFLFHEIFDTVGISGVSLTALDMCDDIDLDGWDKQGDIVKSIWSFVEVLFKVFCETICGVHRFCEFRVAVVIKEDNLDVLNVGEESVWFCASGARHVGV